MFLEGDYMLDYDIKPFIVSELFKLDKLYTMFHQTDDSGTCYVGESHDFWECIYIKEGNSCNCVEGKVYELKEGDLIFYKPMEFHQHHVDDGKKADMFFFSFSLEKCPPDFALDTVYKLNSKQREILKKISDFADNATKNTVFTEEEIAGQKSEYINYDYIKPLLAFSKNISDMSTIVNHIEELFLDLYNTKNIVEETDSYHAGIYRNAVAYMTEHISEKITIPDIARHCSISVPTLKNIFYQFTNISVHRYFIHLKITQAIILLKNGASAYEASERIGFASQAYFSVAFKRETGLTPREYLAKQE